MIRNRYIGEKEIRTLTFVLQTRMTNHYPISPSVPAPDAYWPGRALLALSKVYRDSLLLCLYNTMIMAALLVIFP